MKIEHCPIRYRKTDAGKIQHQTACQMLQKLVPVFGANFWYVYHWHKSFMKTAATILP